MNYLNGFDRLEENIETTIYEGLLKLGYDENESISIFYDLDLINHLLETAFTSNEECINYLNKFISYVNSRFHHLLITIEMNRFKFTVSKEGVYYIYKHNENNHFLKELIDVVKGHSFTLEDITQIFKHYTSDFACVEIDNSEFQYVLYFKDSSIDKFKYCFTFDQMGGYYHRLLDYSFNLIMND